MSVISRAAITREAVPAWFFLIIRALLLLSSGGLVSIGLLHNADTASLVAEIAPAIGAIAWSATEKWREACRLHLAIAAPAGLARPPALPPALPAGLTPPKEPTLMPLSSFDFSKFAAAAEAEFQKLEPEVAAALPSEFAGALKGAVAAVADDAKSAVDAEIEAATHQVPPALQPFAPEIEDLINAGISEAQAEADAKIAKLAAAKASLAPAPVATALSSDASA